MWINHWPPMAMSDSFGLACLQPWSMTTQSISQSSIPKESTCQLAESHHLQDIIGDMSDSFLIHETETLLSAAETNLILWSHTCTQQIHFIPKELSKIMSSANVIQLPVLLLQFQCLLTVIMCRTDHKRSYNVKPYWYVQGRNLTHDRHHCVIGEINVVLGGYPKVSR